MNAPRDETQKLTFTIRGRIVARDVEEGTERLLRALRVFGFEDLGDGSLWLNRPRNGLDDTGMALGEMSIEIDDLDVTAGAR
jgi:hypothetical protein